MSHPFPHSTKQQRQQRHKEEAKVLRELLEYVDKGIHEVVEMRNSTSPSSTSPSSSVVAEDPKGSSATEDPSQRYPRLNEMITDFGNKLSMNSSRVRDKAPSNYYAAR